MMKSKKNGYHIVMPLVRLGFFLLQPALFSAAFTGVKNIITAMANQASLEWNSFTKTLLALVIVTMLFGRIFCGFACAFGTYGDFLYYISSVVRKKYKKKPFHIFRKLGKILKYMKYIILLAILALCAFGMSGMVSENSPWTVFSRLQSGHIPESVCGIVLFALLSIGMLLEPRFFCRFFCPMGAVFSMLPVWPVMRIRRKRENCIPGCTLCQRNCPAQIEIPDANAEDTAGMGECFACGKCMRGCPKKNVYTVKKCKAHAVDKKSQ